MPASPKCRKTIRMPGFRPGKVPPNLVRKMHGEALRGEALQAAINEGVQTLLTEKQLRPATQPQVDLEGDGSEGDVGFKVALEVLPNVDDIKIDDLALEKLVVPADDVGHGRRAARALPPSRSAASRPRPSTRPRTGDTVVIDFEGRVDGKLFDGGKGEGMRVTIGSGQLIPGFEDQLVGAKANDERTVKVTFPEDYGVPALAGKPAEFACLVQGVETPGRDQDRRRIRQGLRARIAGCAEGNPEGPARCRTRHADPHPYEAQAARHAGRAP